MFKALSMVPSLSQIPAVFPRKEERIQLSLKKREENIDCHDGDGGDGGEGHGGSGDGNLATINQTFIFKHFLNIKATV